MARSTLALTPRVDNVDDVMAEHVNTLQTNQEKIWNTLAFVEATELTLDAAGAITVTSNYHTVDTLADAASGNLDTITISGNIGEGSILIIRPDHTDRTIVIRHNQDNILCNGNANITLDDSHDFTFLVYDETLVKWMAFGGGGVTNPLTANLDLSTFSILDQSKFVCNGRLTLETGVPVSTADQADKQTLYFTPYKGNELSLYDGTNWIRHEFTERTLDISAQTASKPHDDFVYNNAGTLTLSSTVWTNATTRATALVMQDGVLCKTGALGYRYLGTHYMDAAQKCQDTLVQRFVWNYYNRIDRVNYNTEGSSHSYNGALRLWNNSETNNRLGFIIGVQEDSVSVNIYAQIYSGTVGSIASITQYIDGAAYDGNYIMQNSIAASVPLGSLWNALILAEGYHYANIYEFGNNAGSTFVLMRNMIVNKM